MKRRPLIVALGLTSAIVAVVARATVAVASPDPVTVEQLCAAQQWPRPVPDVVGTNLDDVTGQGALSCWDHVRAVAPDGHDPINNPASAVDAAGYRITALSPPPGTPVGRHDVVTVQVAGVDRQAPPAFQPCAWVTTDEASGILGGPATAEPIIDSPGSVELACAYTRSQDSGVESELLLPGAFPVDAPSMFALATTTAKNPTTIDGLGIQAACLFNPGTTPPSTALLVVLSGDRLYRAVGKYYMPCDSLKEFAQIAIGRTGA
jgi:hypothetical protein